MYHGKHNSTLVRRFDDLGDLYTTEIKHPHRSVVNSSTFELFPNVKYKFNQQHIFVAYNTVCAAILVTMQRLILLVILYPVDN